MHRRYRSFFWPVVLIVIGVFAILVDLNVISADRLYRLADLWPLILIVIGLELIARRALKGAAVDIAAALILLIAVGGAVAYVSVGPAIPGGTQKFDTSDQIGTLSSASLQVDVGVARMTVEGNTSLGPDLYRAHIEYSGSKPSVTLDNSTGELHISQQGGFGIFENRSLVIDLQISPAVTWSITVNSGAADDTFKLTGVKVSAISLNAAASRAEITVGPPKGMVSITVNGASAAIRVHRPSGTEASAQVSGAAVSLTAGSAARAGSRMALTLPPTHM
jgi:uncharacterized membrane protein YhaH (DUF805 family)